MTTGTGIVVATLIYVAVQALFYWKSSLMDKPRRPAALEARMARVEESLRDAMGADL
jgi:hypothetical protein